jgi:glycerol-3-phosphate acyltransferase PlsY
VKFKGGKGVNTTLGMFIAILPIELLIGLASFVIVVGLSGFVSLGSMIGAAMIPLVLFIRYNLFNVKISDYFTLICFALALVLLLIIAHRSNIIKLIKGTENKMEKMAFIATFIKLKLKLKSNKS